MEQYKQYSSVIKKINKAICEQIPKLLSRLSNIVTEDTEE